ncbi:hypothetical protein QN277_008229 [Acacia crassicarpa]|uniref:Uncharacterized protein n=1 Tax=Acacia crassicarpa TaxID=499986 RepID=A0AAE1M7Z1_9FABA|nr:hypothetical protein QN277_008229 [Acacia crassicarpa]
MLQSSMDSFPLRNSCSKAQMCFFKILRVISSVPPSHQQQQQQQPRHTPNHDLSDSSPTTEAIDVDFNLDFRSPFDNAEFLCSASDYSGVEGNTGRHESAGVSGGKETRLKDQIGEDREVKESEEKGRETVPFEGDTSTRRASYDNCLDLLIEAAKLVFEGPSGERGTGSGLRSRSSNREDPAEQRWVVVDLCNEVNDTSPVVRSKRGRSQTLPFRFRDSVVEPLRRSGTASRASKKRLIGSS